MARVAQAVVKTGTGYHRPSLERSDARWKDPSLQSAREGARCDPVGNVRAFHLRAYVVLSTVRTAATSMPLDPVFAVAGSDPVDGGNHLDQLTADVGALPTR